MPIANTRHEVSRLETHEEWMGALSGLTVIQSERLIVSSGQDELAPIVKTNTGYVSLPLTWYPWNTERR